MVVALQEQCQAPIRRWKKFDDMYINLDTIPDCDGRTDRETDGFAVTISCCACISMLTRDKNQSKKNTTSTR